MSEMIDQLAALLHRGGPVMYPLLILSIAGVTLIIERSWYWLRVHRPGHLRKLSAVSESLRRGDTAAAARLVEEDRSPYARVVRRLLTTGASDAAAVEAVESQRPSIERFMIALSTVITAAPLLGLLGTVTGIIKTFNLLGNQRTMSDPTAISSGIAEALITTAFGLVVAIVTLFPYMVFRAQVDRSIGRLESMIAAAQQAEKAGVPGQAVRSPEATATAAAGGAGPAPGTAPGTAPARREGAEPPRRKVAAQSAE